ncbi:MAG: twin-arginine translocation signal domain-containing protein, partial [Pseudomonadota bacterium]|nr:twin-arginine translocation signal domain-containing protein [Pseudomonadota bacterium]
MTDQKQKFAATRRQALKMLGITTAAGVFLPNLLGRPAFGATPPETPTG